MRTTIEGQGSPRPCLTHAEAVLIPCAGAHGDQNRVSGWSAVFVQVSHPPISTPSGLAHTLKKDPPAQTHDRGVFLQGEWRWAGGFWLGGGLCCVEKKIKKIKIKNSEMKIKKWVSRDSGWVGASGFGLGSGLRGWRRRFAGRRLARWSLCVTRLRDVVCSTGGTGGAAVSVRGGRS